MKHVKGVISFKEPNDGIEFVKEFLEGTHPRTISIYLRMICGYVNKSQDPPRDVLRIVLVCGLMGRTFFEQTIKDDWFVQARKDLDNARFTKINLLRMRHLFIPIAVKGPPSIKHPNGRFHVCLVAISPIARTIDFVDSAWEKPNRSAVCHMAKLMALHLERDINPRDWRNRDNGSAKQGKKGTDRGIYYDANAMVVTFGCSLGFTDKNIQNKRIGMTSELLHGRVEQDGDYHYPVLNKKAADEYHSNEWSAGNLQRRPYIIYQRSIERW